MMSSVFSKNKDVIAMFPVKNLNASQLHDLTLKVLEVVFNTGYTALTVISDNNRVNRNMYQKLCGGSLKPSILNPFSQTILFLLFDTVHLLKSIRNNWLNQTDVEQTVVFPGMKDMSNFDANDLPNICRASVKRLKDLYNSEKHKPIKMAPLLSKKVLCPTKLERQNVLYAVRLFDEKNIATLKSLGSSLQTKHFLEIILTFWKVVNVKHALKGKHLRDSYQDPIRDINSVSMQFLLRLKLWLEEWDTYLIVENTRHGKLTPETQTALTHTVTALYDLAVYMINKLEVKYVLLGKFQSDNLEARFGQYRQMSGGNYNVSVRQVLESERKLKSISLLRLNSSQQGEFSLKHFVGHVATKESENSVKIDNYEEFESVLNEQCYVDIDKNELNVIYIAGYVARQCSCCKECMYKLCIDRPISVEASGDLHKYLDVLDRGGLTYPTRFTFNICSSTIRIFNILISEFYEKKFQSVNCQQHLLMKIAMEWLYIDENVLAQCVCGKSGLDLCKQGVKIISNILLNNYCKLKNNKLDEAKKDKKEQIA